MSTLFPLDPPHALAVGPNLLQTHRLVLYSGQMTGRWFNVTTTHVPAPASGGSREPVTVTEPQKDIVGTGTVTLELSPDPHIAWFFAHNGLVPIDQWPVLIPPSSLSNVFATRIGTTGLPRTPRGHTAFAGTRRIESPVEIGDVDGSLDEIRFYLVNFQVWFLAEDITRTSGTDKGAGMTLRVDSWRIDIERRPEFPQAMSYMEANRGYAITHNCRLRREHAAEFTAREAAPVLEALTLYLSLVRGGMVGMALPVGYNGGTSVVEKWHISAVDPGRYPHPHQSRPLGGWYPLYRPPGYEQPHPAAWLPSLYEQFASRFLHRDVATRKFWQGVLRVLTYTYTDAERLDTDRAIVPACTALETLGWSILVVQEEWLTGDRHPDRGRGGSEKLAAADRVRLLLKWAGLPAQVPRSLQHLRTKASENGNWDGPNVITWTRNRVVHPDKHDQLADGLASEAWLVAMWYAELIILKLLGYNGYFRNRLNDEAVERVPWARP